MAQKAISLTFCTRSAIVNSPDSEMKAIFLEGFELLETSPEILVRIQNDIDEMARQKKRIRQADASWYLSKTMLIPGFDHDESVFKDLILPSRYPLLTTRNACLSLFPTVSIFGKSNSSIVTSNFASI